MVQESTNPFMTPFAATAETALAARPQVDPDVIREIFVEAATLLHNGLALDGLDDHDVNAVVQELCEALVADDPGEAIRACSKESANGQPGFHDPQAVSRSLLFAAEILRV
jgi:hypothetical protein